MILCCWIANCIKTEFLKGEGESKDLYNSLLELLEKIAQYSQIESNKIKLALIRVFPPFL